MPRDPDDRLRLALDGALHAVLRRPALYDMADAVDQTVRTAVETVPAADGGGISIRARGIDGAHGSTSAPAADLDALQHRFGEGPCLTALAGPALGTRVVVAQDLARGDAWRWPLFAPAAARLGCPAVLSLQLPAEVGVGAALNLYSGTAHGFATADLVLADTFVRHLAQLLFGTPFDPGGAPARDAPPGTERDLRRRLDPER
jgi:hypothetical protein